MAVQWRVNCQSDIRTQEGRVGPGLVSLENIFTIKGKGSCKLDSLESLVGVSVDEMCVTLQVVLYLHNLIQI